MEKQRDTETAKETGRGKMAPTYNPYTLQFRYKYLYKYIIISIIIFLFLKYLQLIEP